MAGEEEDWPEHLFGRKPDFAHQNQELSDDDVGAIAGIGAPVLQTDIPGYGPSSEPFPDQNQPDTKGGSGSVTGSVTGELTRDERGWIQQSRSNTELRPVSRQKPGYA